MNGYKPEPARSYLMGECLQLIYKLSPGVCHTGGQEPDGMHIQLADGNWEWDMETPETDDKDTLRLAKVWNHLSDDERRFVYERWKGIDDSAIEWTYRDDKDSIIFFHEGVCDQTIQVEKRDKRGEAASLADIRAAVLNHDCPEDTEKRDPDQE